MLPPLGTWGKKGLILMLIPGFKVKNSVDLSERIMGLDTLDNTCNSAVTLDPGTGPDHQKGF